jgi:hypothetical protein
LVRFLIVYMSIFVIHKKFLLFDILAKIIEKKNKIASLIDLIDFISVTLYLLYLYILYQFNVTI